MYLLLILPILVSGFIFCNQHPVVYSKLHRYEGQYLYLQSAKFGVTCLFYAILLNSIVLWVLHKNFWFCIFGISWGADYILRLSNYLNSSQIVPKNQIQAAWIICIGGLMLLIPNIYCFFYKLYKRNVDNLPTNKKLYSHIQYELLKDSPMDRLLLQSLFEGKNLLISMDDRKVYVGRVTSASEPNEAQGACQEISIKPLLSGYRDKDTLIVDLNTDYTDLPKSVSLTLKQDLIISATFFEFAVYEEFKRRKNIDSAEIAKPRPSINPIKKALKKVIGT